MSIYGFLAEFSCKRPKDVRQIVSQIRQLRGNQRISNAKLFNLECPDEWMPTLAVGQVPAPVWPGPAM